MCTKQIPVSPLLTSLHRWSNKPRYLSFENISSSFDNDAVMIHDLKHDFLKDIISSNIGFDIATNTMLPKELLYQFNIVKINNNENESNMNSIHDVQNLVVVPTITKNTTLGKNRSEELKIVKKRYFYFSPTSSIIRYYQDATNDSIKQKKKGILKRTTYKDRLLGYDSNFKLHWRNDTNDFIILKTLQSMIFKLEEIALTQQNDSHRKDLKDNPLVKQFDCFGYGILDFSETECDLFFNILNGTSHFNLAKVQKAINTIYKTDRNYEQQQKNDSSKIRKQLHERIFNAEVYGDLIIRTFKEFEQKLEEVVSVEGNTDFEVDNERKELIMLSFMTQLFKLCLILDI